MLLGENIVLLQHFAASSKVSGRSFPPCWIAVRQFSRGLANFKAHSPDETYLILKSSPSSSCRGSFLCEQARRVKISASGGKTEPRLEALDSIGTFLVAKPRAWRGFGG
jgi:hypothetical protein